MCLGKVQFKNTTGFPNQPTIWDWFLHSCWLFGWIYVNSQYGLKNYFALSIPLMMVPWFPLSNPDLETTLISKQKNIMLTSEMYCWKTESSAYVKVRIYTTCHVLNNIWIRTSNMQHIYMHMNISYLHLNISYMYTHQIYDPVFLSFPPPRWDLWTTRRQRVVDLQKSN